ncbi:GAF domain-containing protein [Nitriliruptoraceae bacterium ZYF776]|nr:GAF domain-containing protein [Profundirhabdus halotolerans]
MRGVGPLVAALTALWTVVTLVSQVLADPPLSPVVTIVSGVLLTHVVVIGYASTLRGPRVRRRRSPEVATVEVDPARERLTREAAQRTVELLGPLLDGDAVAITDRERMLAFDGPGHEHHREGSDLWTPARQTVFATGRTVVVEGRHALGCPEPDCPLRAATIAPLRVRDEITGTVTVYRTTDRPPDPDLVASVAGILSLTLDLADLQAEARLSADARLEALRAQINPHFLFNTLNTIASRVRTDPEEARQLLVRLADFFRYAVRQHGHLAEFAQEYAFVRTYVTLEQARFGDRLQVHFDVDPQVLGVEVPVLVIQPLVENAIKHGVSSKVGRGHVTLRARVDPLARALDVVVRDDGVGMDPATLDGAVRGARRDGASGVGLTNIAERLTLLYDGRHELDVRSTVDEGTTVRLRLPMR